MARRHTRGGALRLLLVSLSSVGLVAALFAAGTASSRPNAGGVTVSPLAVEPAPYGAPLTGGQGYFLITTATWSPDTTRAEGYILAHDVTGGGDQSIGFYDYGPDPHSSNTFRYAPFAAIAGHRYVLKAHWAAYGRGSDGVTRDGMGDSPLSTLIVPKEEPAPRLDSNQKNQLAQGAGLGYTECALLAAAGATALASGVGAPVGVALILAASAGCGAGLSLHYLSRDPVDLNFRAIAAAKMPPAPKAAAGPGLSPAAATALNRLLATQAQEIGFARALLTSLNRSQGAHVKRKAVWEKKQMTAAGRYAAQLAAALLNEAKLRPGVKTALAGSDVAKLSVAADAVKSFQNSVATGGLPAPFAAALSKLGFTEAEQRELHAQVLAPDPTFLVGSALAAIADPKLLASLRGSVATLKAFSAKAARDPLHTGG